MGKKEFPLFYRGLSKAFNKKCRLSHYRVNKMIVKTITISAKTPDPPPQTKVERANVRPESEKTVLKSDDTTRITKMVADVQNNLQLIKNVDLDFSVNQDSGDIVVTVRDESTGKVIREIPSEEMQNLASNIDSMAGLLLSATGVKMNKRFNLDVIG